MSVLEDEILEHLEALGPTAHLVAVCDMAELDDDVRDAVRERFAGRMVLLLQDPAWQALRPYSPLLLCAESADSTGYYRLVHTFTGKLRYAVHGWIASTIAPENLARHLAQALKAHGPEGDAYLLRHYDPCVLPRLYEQAPQHWWRQFIAPITSWWVPKGDDRILRWGRIPGPGAVHANPPSPLMIDSSLWHALAADPLPYRLLQTVEEQAPGLLDYPCREVRLTHVEALLHRAREAGLSAHDDLHDYVLLSLSTSNLATDRSWQQAIRGAVAGAGRLGELYLTYSRQQR